MELNPVQTTFDTLIQLYCCYILQAFLSVHTIINHTVCFDKCSPSWKLVQFFDHCLCWWCFFIKLNCGKRDAIFR